MKSGNLKGIGGIGLVLVACLCTMVGSRYLTVRAELLHTLPTASVEAASSELELADLPTQVALGNVSCDLDAYVIDKDPKGLNVRSAAGTRGSVVGKIPLDEDGTVVHIVSSNGAGWFQIDGAENVAGEVVFSKKGWVSGNLIETSAQGHTGTDVKLFAESNTRSKVVGKIPREVPVKLTGCSGKWARVKYETTTGWLRPEDQCASPVTTCN